MQILSPKLPKDARGISEKWGPLISTLAHRGRSKPMDADNEWGE